MMNAILKSFEIFVMEPISILRQAIIQVVGIQTDNPYLKGIEVEKVGEKIQLNVINSEKAYNLLATVVYKRNLNNLKGKNENQKSKVHN